MKKVIILVIVLIIALVGVWYFVLRNPNSGYVPTPISSGDEIVKTDNMAVLR